MKKAEEMFERERALRVLNKASAGAPPSGVGVVGAGKDVNRRIRSMSPPPKPMSSDATRMNGVPAPAPGSTSSGEHRHEQEDRRIDDRLYQPGAIARCRTLLLGLRRQVARDGLWTGLLGLLSLLEQLAVVRRARIRIRVGIWSQ